MVHTITEVSEVPQQGAVVIDFFATWCGPCKRIAPTFENLEKAFTSVKFLKVDVDESAELVDMFGVQAMPTFVFLKDGQVVKKVEGADLTGLETGFEMITK